MRKRKIAGIVCLTLLLSLLLPGCASKSAERPEHAGVQILEKVENLTPEGGEFEAAYVSKILDLDRSLEGCEFEADGNGLLRVFSLNGGLFVYDEEGRLVQELCPEEEGRGTRVYASPSGRLCFVGGREAENKTAWETVVTTPESGDTPLLSWVESSGAFSDVHPTDSSLLVSRWIGGGFTLSLYDWQGNLRHSLELTEYNWIYLADGRVYLVGDESGAVKLLDEDSGALTTLCAANPERHYGGVRGGWLYLYDEEYAYRLNLESGEEEPLFRWDALHLSPARLYPVGTGDALFAYDRSSATSPARLIYPINAALLPAERSTVVLATNAEEYGTFRDAIRDFNATNWQYELIVKNYHDCADPQTALNVDIAAGNGPDLVDMFGFSETMVNGRNCEDLLPWLEQDGELTAEMLLAAPLEAMQTNGKLYSWIPSFGVAAIAGPGEVLKGKTADSYEALAALAGGAERVFGPQTLSRTELLQFAFGNNRRGYTAEKVEDILRFAAQLPEGPALSNWGRSDEENINRPVFKDRGPILEGEQVMDTATFVSAIWGGSSFSSASGGGVATEHILFGPELAFTGFPVADGSAYLLRPAQELILLRGAQNKEGAWAFLKFLLADRYQIDYGLRQYRCGIPLTKSAFETVLTMDGERIRAGETVEDFIAGNFHTYTLCDPNDLNLFRTLVEGVGGIYRGEDELYQAVLPLAESYFSGDKPIDQAARDIASRLRVYAAEQG